MWGVLAVRLTSSSRPKTGWRSVWCCPGVGFAVVRVGCLLGGLGRVYLFCNAKGNSQCELLILFECSSS